MENVVSMTKASGQCSAFLRIKFFLLVEEIIPCGILFQYLRKQAPKLALNCPIHRDLRCASGADGGMRRNLAGVCFSIPVEMLFHLKIAIEKDIARQMPRPAISNHRNLPPF
ncbi:hypothetical protein N5C66_09125 [Rhizobium pusense]|nr:hypothetical protein [Agrobacterium sp. S2]MDH1111888.1 hypothetical protein [Agrobacterium pusense]